MTEPSTLTIRPISAEEARPLRHAMLRPGAPLEKSLYPGDDAPTTRHAGAFVDGELVGVATVIHQPPPGSDDAGAWRLRGMAVRESTQRRGYGRAVLEHCFAYLREQGATLFWCNARTPAVPFYEALGFQTEGDEFLTEEPHYRMGRRIEQEP